METDPEEPDVRRVMWDLCDDTKWICIADGKLRAAYMLIKDYRTCLADSSLGTCVCRNRDEWMALRQEIKDVLDKIEGWEADLEAECDKRRMNVTEKFEGMVRE